MHFKKSTIAFITLCIWCLAFGSSLAWQADSEEDVREDQIWQLEIEGNDTFSSIVLKEQIASEAHSFWNKLRFWKRTGHELNITTVRKDVIRLGNFYRRRGFYNVNVDYRVETKGKEWKKKLVFVINENAAIRIGKINFVFQTDSAKADQIRQTRAFQRMQRRLPFQSGERFQQIMIPDVVGQVKDVVRNQGFPYAKVSVESEVDTAGLSADLSIISNTGPKAAISEINVEGMKSISDRYVIRESGLKIGQTYSHDKIQEAQRELFNHHLFQFVTIGIPEQQQDSTLNLQMRVREAPLRTIEASLGFGTSDLVRGQLSWIHRNAFGKGHRFTATGRASFIQQLVSLDYLFPYFYNNKSSIVISPFGEHQLEESFELFTLGLTNSYIYSYNQNLTGTISYEATKNIERSEKRNIDLPDSTNRYDLSSLQFNGYFSQGYGREQLGWVVQPYLELSGFLNIATYKFQKASIDVRRFTRITKSTILATRVQAGGILKASSDSLPRNIRYFLGGTNSVRGWYRQSLGPKQANFRTQVVEGDTVSTFDRYVPVGGRAKFGFNIELRQDLNKLLDGFGISAFLDGGQVWGSVNTLSQRPIQFGAGGGFRYQSPIGPIRIDLGYKLNPSDEDLGIYGDNGSPGFWDKAAIHFSIGQAF
ncbi:BamA/TamA family outer membrane protein [Balneolaceae bacterium YR4-1]|uniref:BamA/TamA family outer membrane protein n=1 Tax=Halalkalibaculum roseum TaxID=2709311 RepID=A0A6M1SYC3_9BACT|nr:BamA/TamA family outer membrane protein [Halalkalibaculum roseum]